MSVDILSSVEIFKDLTEQELVKIHNTGEVQTVQKGSYVVIEGEQTYGMYIILDGRLSVFKRDITNGNFFKLATLEVNSFFGEMSLFDHAPRSASVAADIQSRVFFLDADKFNEILNSSEPKMKARFYERCAKDLAERFRNLNNEYVTAQKQLWRHVLRTKIKKKSTPIKEASGR